MVKSIDTKESFLYVPRHRRYVLEYVGIYSRIIYTVN